MPTGRPLVWTIKAQPTEVHNITSTSTSTSINLGGYHLAVSIHVLGIRDSNISMNIEQRRINDYVFLHEN